MKFSLETSIDVNHIHSYDDNGVVIKHNQNVERYATSSTLIISPNQIITDCPINDITELNSSDVAYLENLNVEVIILASQSNKRLQPKTLVEFSKRAIGIETMQLGPACRTFNLLVAEGRRVLIIIQSFD